MKKTKVAVIGAGMAGLACAARLKREGVDVAVYDKGRGPGGRASSRSTPAGRFDHGAQYFTVRDDDFRARVAAWQALGLAAPWQGRFVHVDADGSNAPLHDEGRYTGLPKMNAFIAHEAEEAGAAFGLKLGPPRRGRRGEWVLRGENGQDAWAADWVVLAVPAEQAAMLLQETGEGGSPSLAAEATHALTAPTWTLMADFGAGAPASFDAASVEEGPLAFVGREASRPGREPGGRFVAHASRAWSRDHLEAEKGDVIEALSGALAGLLGVEGQRPIFADAHRWRYAFVEKAASTPYGLDDEARLATCGDWRIAPRLESAWVSGNALGAALLDRL